MLTLIVEHSRRGDRMPATSEDVLKANEILAALEAPGDAAWLRQEATNSFEDELCRWVEHAVTQLVLLIGSTPFTYAQAVREADKGPASIVVSTDDLVAIATVDDIADSRARPQVTAVSRRKIQSLGVFGGDRMVFTSGSIADRHAEMRWPGVLHMTIHYDGLVSAVKVSGAGVNVFNRDAHSPIRELLSSLRTDLETAD